MKITMVASGDSRLSANQICWPAQQAMETTLCEVLAGLGHQVERAHPYKPDEKHGFIAGQKEGLDVFSQIDAETPIMVAESVWQYSHHVLPRLILHRGAILTVANWSGQWPGLVGLLNLNGGLTKAGRAYSTLWSETFEDKLFLAKLRSWLETGSVEHDLGHVSAFDADRTPGKAKKVAEEIAADLKRNRSILGVFDEGCMGMYNAIIPDELLFPMGLFKERLSQSALFAAMNRVSDEEAQSVFEWIVDKKFTFHFGEDPATDLTQDQVLEQCRMYIAACRLGDAYGCEAIGIQYQLGLVDVCAASDLAEGLLNNDDRPPVANPCGRIIKKGEPFTHFNEVDECAGVDGLLTNRIHSALGQPMENTLHDLRWGDIDRSGTVEDYIWVFLISGGAPPAHHIGGYAGSHGYRQPPMYFPAGGSTLQGVAKPGEIVWSRIYVEPGRLSMDIGRGTVVDLPEEETRRRLEATTPEWPIMHAALHGATRDQMMAKHKANHVQVAYANSAEEADLCMAAKAHLAGLLGLKVNLCGVTI